MNIWLIIGGIVVLLILFIVGTYNSLVTKRRIVNKAWSDIDVQLMRRFDLIPNLVETIKGITKHEESVFTQIAKYRSAYKEAGSVEEKQKIANDMAKTMIQVNAVAENYPELKANKNFLQLQDELANTENKIAYSRQYYNESVTMYNMAIETIPSNIIASLFNFKEATVFQADEKARENVSVKF